MKPVIFKNVKDLVQFINGCPRVPGTVKVQGQDMGSHQILDECAKLAGDMFRYKDVLAKGKGGLGNNKSVLKYTDIVADNAVVEAQEKYDAAIAGIAEEVTALINGGVATQIADSLGEAKTALEVHNKTKNVIKKLEEKLNSRMAAVTAAYKKLSSELNTLQKKHSKDKELVSALKASHEEIEAREVEATKLTEKMVRYCDLQVGYMSLCAATGL